MKLIKLIFLSACLVTFVQLAGQDINPEEVYYGLELAPATIEGDTSTSKQVLVVMDASDLDLFTTISVESSVKTKDLKVSKEDRKDNPRRLHPHAPTVSDIPKDYMDSSAVHICPMDYTSQSQLLTAFKAGLTTTVTLDPEPAYMIPDFLKDLRIVLNGLTAFLPSLKGRSVRLRP